VLLAGRNVGLGSDSAERIRTSTGNDAVSFARLDLGSLESARSFGKSYAESGQDLHLLLAAGKARVVVLSSRAHRCADVDFEDPNYRHRPYDPWKSYGQSKSANTLFAVGLTRRYGASGIVANSVMHGGDQHGAAGAPGARGSAGAGLGIVRRRHTGRAAGMEDRRTRRGDERLGRGGAGTRRRRRAVPGQLRGRPAVDASW
jgi:NAD(P)-dependent dehydrogenase (short-subunit alcohol dehydrogenase family)